MRLKVESYSGYKADQRPTAFTLNGHTFQVKELLDTWYGPDHAYFKVRADDSNIYILKHSPESNEWSLEMFRQGDRP
jgi:hypothetical protein